MRSSEKGLERHMIKKASVRCDDVFFLKFQRAFQDETPMNIETSEEEHLFSGLP